MTNAPLPYGHHEISDADIEAVASTLRRDLITQGPMVPEFESAFADYVGARHAVAVSSGTAALHAAAHAAGLGPGDELITTPLTFVASANCALFCGARPRFVDIDPATWNLDTAAVARTATGSTRAVVAVSFAGLPVDLAPLAPLRDHAVVIEDASHALGALRNGAKVGGPGGADMTTFSLHPVKAMTTGEGGVVTTDDDRLAASLRAFRTHGMTREDMRPESWEGSWYYDVRTLGYNYRVTDFQCALGLSQLARLDGWITRRNEIAHRYRELLADDPRIDLPPAAGDDSLHAHHLFVIRVLESREKRREVFEALRESGIIVQVHYVPIYRFPYYRDALGYPQDDCPAAEEYYAGAISLPIFPTMSSGDVERVVDTLRTALA